MVPAELLAEGLPAALVRAGLYVGAAVQLACLLAAAVLPDAPADPPPQLLFSDRGNTDSDDYSSEQSSPGHRTSGCKIRKQDKKKRR